MANVTPSTVCPFAKDVAKVPATVVAARTACFQDNPARTESTYAFVVASVELVTVPFNVTPDDEPEPVNVPIPAEKLPDASLETIADAVFALVAFDVTVNVALLDEFALKDADPDKPVPETASVSVPSLISVVAANIPLTGKVTDVVPVLVKVTEFAPDNAKDEPVAPKLVMDTPLLSKPYFATNLRLTDILFPLFYIDKDILNNLIVVTGFIGVTNNLKLDPEMSASKIAIRLSVKTVPYSVIKAVVPL